MTDKTEVRSQGSFPASEGIFGKKRFSYGESSRKAEPLCLSKELRSPVSNFDATRKPTLQEAVCPQCGSQRLFKDGIRYLQDEQRVQRWLCRNCSYRFSRRLSENSLSISKDPKEPLYTSEELQGLRRVCVKEAKNLDATEIKTVAGDESPESKRNTKVCTFEGKIIEFLWWMQKQGYKETTIISRGSRLRRLSNLHANLNDPESIKEIIAIQKNWTDARKEAMVFAYDLYAKWQGLNWQRPRYKAIRKLPFIPLEREIDDLIAACTIFIALFLQLAKETGARAGELYRLEWIDIDFESRTVSLTAEKGSNPRIFKMSNKLLTMLNGIQKKDQKIFCHYKHLNSLRRCYERQRKRTAAKLGNPRLQKITFHTLRHWKGTMEYHKTKDILHVMQVLGHKNIKNTLLYTQLIQLNESDDQYVCKVAKTPKEIQELIENGFEFICTLDDFRFFRKRK